MFEKTKSRIFGVLTVMGVGVYVGLFSPDLDLLLLPILHHRSIVTHSILIPLLLKKFLPKPLYGGWMIGISIHLFADSLSPMVGFGQAYIPFVAVGLGSLSIVWFLGNAVAGATLGVREYPEARPLVIFGALMAALAYAILNEGAVFLSYVLVVIGIVAAVRHWSVSRKSKHDEDEKV